MTRRGKLTGTETPLVIQAIISSKSTGLALDLKIIIGLSNNPGCMAMKRKQHCLRPAWSNATTPAHGRRDELPVLSSDAN